MADLTLKYCTYISIHGSGFYYAGKGITDKVVKGEYKGSGVKFKVTCAHPGFELEHWITNVLETFATEAEAFAAEEFLVPLNRLIDPYCLNIQKGGLKGRGCNHYLVYRMMNAAKRREAKQLKQERAKAKKIADKEKQRLYNEKYRKMQQLLKDKQNEKG